MGTLNGLISNFAMSSSYADKATFGGTVPAVASVLFSFRVSLHLRLLFADTTNGLLNAVNDEVEHFASNVLSFGLFGSNCNDDT